MPLGPLSWNVSISFSSTVTVLAMRSSVLKGFSSALCCLLYSVTRSLMHMVGLLLLTLNPQPATKANGWKTRAAQRTGRITHSSQPPGRSYSLDPLPPASLSSFQIYDLWPLKEWLISLGPVSFFHPSFIILVQAGITPTLLQTGWGEKGRFSSIKQKLWTGPSSLDWPLKRSFTGSSQES